MAVAGLSSAPFSLLSPPPLNISNSNSKFSTFETIPISDKPYSTSTTLSSALSTLHCSRKFKSKRPLQSFCFSSSVESAEYILEPTTNVKFETSLRLPGCSSPLSLLGTGFREKVFAIIGVKIYAVGLYSNPSIIENLSSWNGRSETEYRNDPSFFDSIFRAPMEKALQIILVRDIDGKTFWDALNDAISSRIKSPTSDDESSLSTFRSIFQGRPLKKGSVIILTWLDPSKMLVSISSDGPPSSVDATVESTGINLALFDVFLGDAPVSPSLKDAVCNGLAKILK